MSFGWSGSQHAVRPSWTGGQVRTEWRSMLQTSGVKRWACFPVQRSEPSLGRINPAGITRSLGCPRPSCVVSAPVDAQADYERDVIPARRGALAHQRLESRDVIARLDPQSDPLVAELPTNAAIRGEHVRGVHI